ncbi:protein kinase, putative [Bodo saltans]|uniref:mitogen-activated protein kinase kinase n=1 Tax=Bodo saltans TaxID=75058 RepID=A0A0S4IQX7_BODSA|nr:protein kinase, putative [Bodo saltans]|eukprot:CUF99019.1 protein kinase, putative [Bodo saltans]
MPPPPGLGLKIDVGSVAAELAKHPDITQGGTVHLGEMIVSASGLISQSGETIKFLSPDDISVNDAGFLGRGSSGSVRKVRRSGTDTFMALKEIKVTSQNHLQEIRRELATLHVDKSDDPSQPAPVQCPYLVDFYGAYSHEGCVYIAMECMDGSLVDLAPMPDAALASVSRDVLLGLQYLHQQRRLIHRDMKPGNVLYNATTGCAKISDFGVSSALDQHNESAHTFVGTVTYMSPERLRGESYSFEGDVWSWGISVAELALGAHPYSHLTNPGDSTETKFWVLMQHLNGDGPVIALPSTFNPLLAAFIHACLTKDAATRPTIAELLKHPFITTFAGVEHVDASAIRTSVTSWIAEKKQKAQQAQREPKSGGINLESALTRLVDMKKR